MAGQVEAAVSGLRDQMVKLTDNLVRDVPHRKWIRTPEHKKLVEATHVTHLCISQAAEAARDFFSYGGRGYAADNSASLTEIRKLEAISEEIARHKLDNLGYADLRDLACEVVGAGHTYDLDLEILISEERKANESPPKRNPSLRSAFDRPPTGAWV